MKIVVVIFVVLFPCHILASAPLGNAIHIACALTNVDIVASDANRYVWITENSAKNRRFEDGIDDTTESIDSQKSFIDHDWLFESAEDLEETNSLQDMLIQHQNEIASGGEISGDDATLMAIENDSKKAEFLIPTAPPIARCQIQMNETVRSSDVWYPSPQFSVEKPRLLPNVTLRARVTRHAEITQSNLGSSEIQRRYRVFVGVLLSWEIRGPRKYQHFLWEHAVKKTSMTKQQYAVTKNSFLRQCNLSSTKMLPLERELGLLETKKFKTMLIYLGQWE